MMEQSVLETPRLRLRPVELSDASAIQKAASAREIAHTMISLQHPYPAGEAERYITRERAEREAGRSVTFTIEQKAESRKQKAESRKQKAESRRVVLWPG